MNKYSVPYITLVRSQR